MARQFRPERVEYDVLTAHPEAAQAAAGVTDWATAAVDSVTVGPLSGLTALKDYALSVVPRLRDFAEHIADPAGTRTRRRCATAPTTACARWSGTPAATPWPRCTPTAARCCPGSSTPICAAGSTAW
ncbi:hypothetical protein ACFQ9X_07050 [Catenulispora yoronensis]